MSARHTFRILVTARLSAAAEEIFALYDRTIAEYEEELRLCKEKQRRQEQLEILRPTVMLYRAAEGLYLPGQSGVACPQAPQILPQSQEIPETPRIKEEPEEQRIKQEEEQLPELDQEFSIDCVKTEESSPLQQTALRVGTWGEDSSTQTEWKFYDTKDHEDRKASVNCSCASMETEADGDHTYHAPIRNTGDRSSYAYRCPFCDKVLTSDSKLERHIALHIGAAETEVFVGDHAYHITASRGSSEETQGNCSVTDSGEDQRPPLGCLSEQMETEAYEDHNYQIRNTGDMARDTYVQMPSQNPGPGLNQEVSKTTQVKEEPEEQSIKQLPVPVPESVSVKTEESSVDCMQKEESSLLQQTELRDESQTEDFITEDFIKETLGNSSDTDNDEDWGAPLSCSVGRTTGQNSDLSSEHTTTAETSASLNTADMLKNGQEAQRHEGKGHQCPFCEKVLWDRCKLKRHISVHARERPFSCSTCGKRFTQNYVLQTHIRIHTSKIAYTCSICNKSFTQASALFKHKVTHMEKPFSCSVCKRGFSLESALRVHMRTHREKITFNCSNCERTFSSQMNLERHENTHADEKTGLLTCKKRSKAKTVEKLFSCCICNKSFP